MEPVHTKVHDASRRTKYIYVGLVAIICVLTIQLYRQHTVKKELVRRKSFLLGKLLECRVSKEKLDSKLKETSEESDELNKKLSYRENEHDKTSQQLANLKVSFDKKSEELQNIQRSAEESRTSLSDLQKSYEAAMNSVTTMQGKLDETINTCAKHKETNLSLNKNLSDKGFELSECHKKLSKLQEHNLGLQQENQNLNGKVEEKNKLLETRARGDVDVLRSNVGNVERSRVDEKVLKDNKVASQFRTNLRNSSQNLVQEPLHEQPAGVESKILETSENLEGESVGKASTESVEKRNPHDEDD